ncbi:serine hydrolase [Bacillus sp. SIMBA_005]|uniref:serine hydrolase n=1 Tax=Bacillus sp. SIMBA_005 TaxID=3085754 RepID=UPI00397AD71B
MALSDIEKFFIDRTDGGAHTYWLEVNDFSEHATLLDVAKGMMQFSSNACTDYLIDLLDLERINDQMKQAGLTEHDELMPLTPMLLWSAYVSDRRRDAYKKMSGVSEEQYKSLMNEIFNIMKNDPKHKKALEGKGGATLFVFTGALYRKTDTSSISISFFINDPKANHSHWVGEVFNEFILTAAVDQNFRQRLIQAFTK